VGVLGVPRRYDNDEALRQRALEHRAKGLCYREIARGAWLRVFKVYQLILPYENPRSRLGRFTSLPVGLKSLAESLEILRV
jgi:hypothetical protein